MKIKKLKLINIIKEELTKEMISSSDPMGGHDAAQWNYARTMLDSKMKSVLQDKESQVLDIDDKKIMRVMRGLHNVIGSNPHISSKNLSESIDVEKVENINSAIQDAYKQMMIPVKQDQVYADTGGPVSKDPKDMHEEAVKMIMSMVNDAIDEVTPEALKGDPEEGFPSSMEWVEKNDPDLLRGTGGKK